MRAAILLAFFLITGLTLPEDTLYEYLWHDVPEYPMLKIRGIAQDLRLYGGNPIYEDQWSMYAANDRTVENIFHNRVVWHELFSEFERLHFNTLLLIHPHPFPLFIDYGDTYPEATWLKPEELRDKQEMLRWIISTGKKHGVDIYFLFWNIWTPPGYAMAHGISQEGVDTPEIRAFMRWSVKKLFDTYPDLGGLATMAGEAPPGCSDFVRDAIVTAMNEVKPHPRLLYWSWCSNPPQAQDVVEAYEGESWVMKYLQYEQFFARKADPRIGLYRQDMGNPAMLAIGGPKVSHAGLLFAHPGFICDVITDLYTENGGRGLLTENVMSEERWLSRLAFARYAWDATVEYDRNLWEHLIAERYGSDTLAEPLLCLFENASLVVPTQMKLTHSQCAHFMLQPGLMLSQILAMPTLSTYVFENEQRLDERGYLLGNLGLSRPNPYWGEWIIPITQSVLEDIPDEAQRKHMLEDWLTVQHALGFQPRPSENEDRTPFDVISELETIISKAEKALNEVQKTMGTGTKRISELEHMVALAKANIFMGKYYALKNKAAIAWERWRILGDESVGMDCHDFLESSLDAWYTYASHMDTMYPAFWYRGCDLSLAPPWSQNELWNSYSTRNIEPLSNRTILWKNELDIVRRRIRESISPPDNTIFPPLADELLPLQKGTEVARIDFEKDDVNWSLVTNTCRVELTNRPGEAINGMSLLADSRGVPGRFHIFLQTEPSQIQFKPLTQYQVRLKYHVLDTDKAGRDAIFIVFRSTTGGIPEADAGSSPRWRRPSGTQSTRVFDAVTGDFPDYQIVLGFDGEQCVVIDGIVVIEVGPEK